MSTRTTFVTFVCLCLAAPLFAQGPPDESGIVERGEYSGIKWYQDVNRDYTAFHGVDIIAWCAGDPNPEVGVWQYQDVLISGDPEWLIKTTEHGDNMPTSVWPIVTIDPPGPGLTLWDRICPNLEGIDPIATGTADVVLTDNDLTGGFYEPTERMNAYHLSAHGVLYSFGEEEPMRFSGGFNCQWPGYPADYDETVKCKVKILLH
jgi:hypothetical protein